MKRRDLTVVVALICFMTVSITTIGRTSIILSPSGIGMPITQDTSGNYQFGQGQAANMTFWEGTVFPTGCVSGQPYYRTDLGLMYVYNGSNWVSTAIGAQGPTGPTGPAGATGATGATGPAGAANGLSFNYLIMKNSTAYYMINSTGNIVDSKSSGIAELQLACNNLTSGGGVINLCNSFDGDSATLQIYYSGISIIGLGSNGQPQDTATYLTPRIDRVIYNGTVQEIDGGLLQGIACRDIDFNATTHAVVGITVRDCTLRPDGSTLGKGLRFLGDHINYYDWFDNLYIYDTYDQTSDNSGCISFQQTATLGVGQIYFEQLIYKSGSNNNVMCCWLSQARTDEVVEFDSVNIVNTGHSNFKAFYFQQGTKQKPLLLNTPSFELHITETIFTMDAGHSGATQLHQIQMNNAWLSGGDAGQTLTLISNNAADSDYYGNAMSWFSGCNNRFFTDSGLSGTTFQIGSTGATTHFAWNLGYTYYNGTNLVSNANMTG